MNEPVPRLREMVSKGFETPEGVGANEGAWVRSVWHAKLQLHVYMTLIRNAFGGS